MTRRSLSLLVASAAALFVVAAVLPSTALFDRNINGDAQLYRTYALHVVHGDVPYRDFFMEYPPVALPAFGAPLVTGRGLHRYDQTFKLAMLLCTLGCLLLAAVALRYVGASRRRTTLALGVIAVSPVLAGSNLTTHYDPWPALLTTLAVVLVLTGRWTWGFVALAVAVAAKVYPLVLLPVLLVYVLRSRDRREAVRGGVAFAAGLAVCLVPFALVGAGGLRYSLEFQTRRPLQIESLGSSLLLTAHQLGLYTVHEVSSFNSANLGGSLPHALETLTLLATVAALLLVWWLFWRGTADGEALLTACAAAVASYVALGKVLSPQYLVWLVPLVPLVAGRPGFVASVLLAAALVLTQLLNQWHSGIGTSSADWVVLARNLVLVAMLVVLALALRRRPSAAPGASGRT